jgi:hypothetical protein
LSRGFINSNNFYSAGIKNFFTQRRKVNKALRNFAPSRLCVKLVTKKFLLSRFKTLPKNCGMKKNNIIYWIVTILFSLFMLFSSFNEIRNTPDAQAFMSHLRYPDYFNQFIGMMKVLGIIAILVPGFPRIKEWAYAGLFFDLVGATYSQIAIDGFKSDISFMLLPFIFLFASYIYFHKRMNNTGSRAM